MSISGIDTVIRTRVAEVWQTATPIQYQYDPFRNPDRTFLRVFNKPNTSNMETLGAGGFDLTAGVLWLSLFTISNRKTETDLIPSRVDSMKTMFNRYVSSGYRFRAPDFFEEGIDPDNDSFIHCGWKFPWYYFEVPSAG